MFFYIWSHVERNIFFVVPCSTSCCYISFMIAFDIDPSTHPTLGRSVQKLRHIWTAPTNKSEQTVSIAGLSHCLPRRHAPSPPPLPANNLGIEQTQTYFVKRTRTSTTEFFFVYYIFYLVVPNCFNPFTPSKARMSTQWFTGREIKRKD